MSFANKKGIALAGGFKLQAEAPLDARMQVDSIADRDELVTIHAAWEGMVVYVKADKTSYEYKGSNTWTPVLTGTMYKHPSTHPATMITEDTTHRFMTDTERNKLKGIAEGANNYTHPGSHSLDMITETDTKKIMTSAERTKLQGIEAGANKYTHPSTHSADMIVDTTTKVMMTLAERNKLSGISGGANAYTHPDSHPATMITQDETHRFMTDTERAKLQGIAANANNYTHPTSHSLDMIIETTTKKIMTDAERTKLQGIEAGANKYTHPGSHPASIITQDTSHRFVTDTEINTWNAKSGKSTKSTVTLSADSWVAATTGYKYTLSVSGVTTSNNVEVVLLSFPHTAVPSADHLRICPEAPPAGICLFPDEVGCV